jgi:type II secretory pathway pseudopilin PulG
VHTRPRPGSSDTGETLIELIIAVAIMGITVVALVGGTATFILMSDVHRKQATAGSYVRSYAEAVQAYVAAGNFDATTSPNYDASTVLPPQTWKQFTAPNTGFNTPDVSVQCWDDARQEFPKPPAGNGCTTSSTLQQVTLNVASADSVAGQRGASESLVVVVRKP